MRVVHAALLAWLDVTVPSGFEVDHLCHTEALRAGLCGGGLTCNHRRCIRPEHLEVVTRAENVARQHQSPTCPNGHVRTPESTYVRPDNGRRQCRECMKAATLRWSVKSHRGSAP